MIITNLQNPQVKSVASLQKKKYREEVGRFVIEGVRFVEEALGAGVEIHQIFFTEKARENSRGADLLELAASRNIPLHEVTDGVMKKLSDTETPQGVLAVLQMPVWSAEEVSLKGLGLLIDGVQDPGNMGTILRTAHAAGVKQVWVTTGTVDIYNPKTLRSTMGSIFHLQVVPTTAEEFLQLATSNKWQMVVADVGGQEPYYGVDMLQPTVIVVGSEARGPSDVLVQKNHKVVYIPMPGQAESLNVAIAAGILMFEAVRQQEAKA